MRFNLGTVSLHALPKREAWLPLASASGISENATPIDVRVAAGRRMKLP